MKTCYASTFRMSAGVKAVSLCVSGLWHPFCPTVQMVLSEGGVPPRPVVFVSRPELVNQIREKLYRLQNEPGWVTVFGMAGSGKSVLAAEAVRHHSLIDGDFI